MVSINKKLLLLLLIIKNVDISVVYGNKYGNKWVTKVTHYGGNYENRTS